MLVFGVVKYIHILIIFFLSEWPQHLALKQVRKIDVIKHSIIVLPIHIHGGGLEEGHKNYAKEEVGMKGVFCPCSKFSQLHHKNTTMVDILSKVILKSFPILFSHHMFESLEEKCKFISSYLAHIISREDCVPEEPMDNSQDRVLNQCDFGCAGVILSTPNHLPKFDRLFEFRKTRRRSIREAICFTYLSHGESV